MLCDIRGIYGDFMAKWGFTPQSFPRRHQQVQGVRSPGPNYDIICRVEGEGLNVSFSAQRAIGFGETLEPKPSRCWVLGLWQSF